MKSCRSCIFLAAIWMLAADVTVPAAEPPAADPLPAALAAHIDRTLAELDDDSFATRGRAREQLEAWAADSAARGLLAERIAEALDSGAISFEVRSRLEPLAARLPEATRRGPPAAVALEQVGPTIDRLQSDSSSVRAVAERQIAALLTRTEMIGPVWLELKRRALDPALSSSARRQLEPLLDLARQSWLLVDPAAVALPPVSRQQIVDWIGELTQVGERDAYGRFRREMAERELLDGMARDDTREQVAALLLERMDTVGDEATVGTLRTIADFARPALAAEVWGRELDGRQRVEHRTIQYLIVGMPQFNEAAQRATHFDRVDEQTAHCVTGNSLVEGDYPVRVAIPHPDPANPTFFYLTNLPTARRRLAYEYLVRRDESTRLSRISRRTADDFLANQRVLTEAQVAMLGLLDPQVVSRFSGAYFRAVPDRRLVTTNTELARQSTVHRGICQILVAHGTREAVPGLEKLGRSGRVEPTHESPFQIAWMAALAIAARDPWPEVDRWLADLITESTPLVMGIEAPPELGATAAALLVDRRGASTRPFGLETAGESLTERLPFIGYRFAHERGRQDVLRWWGKGQSAPQSAAP